MPAPPQEPFPGGKGKTSSSSPIASRSRGVGGVHGGGNRMDAFVVDRYEGVVEIMDNLDMTTGRG